MNGHLYAGLIFGVIFWKFIVLLGILILGLFLFGVGVHNIGCMNNACWLRFRRPGDDLPRFPRPPRTEGAPGL